MTRQEKALQLFNSGYNCAQSVLLSFADIVTIDEKTAASIASGFGGGMGRLQKTCGALTGSFMVIGLYNSQYITDETERKSRINHLIQSLEQDFTARFGYSDCSMLTMVNLNTDLGQEQFELADINSRVCEKSIVACISWLNKNLVQS
ncbi:MAG: C_GCAxxG_C_C family protein [Bacteroidales bacterium]|nr:C_GCAxxG_C_C family protein [Bacteroidales bacterium]